jgi:hypothetical protein
METEFGNQQRLMEIYMWEPTKATKRVVMVDMCGQTAVFMKDISHRMLSNFIINNV